MNSGKLKLGILLDSYQIPAWIYHSLERVVNSSQVEILLVVLNEKKNFEDENGRNLRNRRTVLYELFNKTDERIFISGPNALEIMNAEKLLSSIPVIKVKPLKREMTYYIEPSDIDEIREIGLDIFVKIGFGMLRGDILTASKYGVWTYWFEGYPPGFWEVVKGQPETKSYLLILDEEANGGRTIYHSSTSTYPFSPARNRNRSLWLASSFLPRQIALLHRLGEKGFFATIKKYEQVKPPLQQKSPTPPSNLLSLWLVATLLAKNIIEIFRRNYYLDGWFLLFDMNAPGSMSFGNYKKIIPPKDRFWSDPHVIQKNGNYYVFVEEFTHDTKKGHISVIVVDQQGNPSDPVRVLEKEYHLSYPYVFRWKDKVYLIPESADNRSIDLYECLEFPVRWVHKITLMQNIKAVDTTVLFAQGKWWLFTGVAENEAAFPEVELFLFFSDNLFTSEWTSHPKNPIVSDLRSARSAGRIFAKDGKLFRPSQNCSKSYGYGFNLNEILVLSETDYEEKTVVSVIPWDKSLEATHTYSVEGKFTVIDAFTKRRKFL